MSSDVSADVSALGTASAGSGGGAGRTVDEPMIVVDGVAKRFGGTVAIERATFTVNRGEFAVLIGPSGSGKSTLLHLIAALDRTDTGRITVDGSEVSAGRGHLNRFRRQEIGLVFQLHNLIPRLTARQNVELAMFGTHVPRKERRARAAELLESVGLGAKLGFRPPEMSGGERQRVAVARALANRPSVLLADEPTGSLDDVSTEVIIKVFEALVHEHGTTILAVSHDSRLTSRADRTILVAGGVADDVVNIEGLTPNPPPS